jgi:hypothetical protein
MCGSILDLWVAEDGDRRFVQNGSNRFIYVDKEFLIGDWQFYQFLCKMRINQRISAMVEVMTDRINIIFYKTEVDTSI